MEDILILDEKGSAKRAAGLFDALGGGRSAQAHRLLFVCAHDDDAAIGAGMVMALAAGLGAEVHVAIVTDGRMGYYKIEERSSLVQIRARETMVAYRHLGLDEKNIHLLGFPDGDTWRYMGRRVAQSGDPDVKGYTGIENSLCWVLRKVRPTIVFSASLEDIHPDHKSVNQELLISIFHASNGIWPELGVPIARPDLFEWPTYMRPVGQPAIGLFAGSQLFERKLEAIAMWASQADIIGQLISSQRAAGPQEFLWHPGFSLYDWQACAREFGR